MILGYGIEFTAAGAEIAEETRRLTEAFNSLCVASAVSAPAAVNSIYSHAFLKALIVNNFNLHTLHITTIYLGSFYLVLHS